jgi:hypothetical protein
MTDIVIYKADALQELQVRLDEETVWLTQAQMVALFGRDKSVISRHITNIFREGELNINSVVANFATTALDGKVYQVEYYNLDVIISVGYRVKSQRGTQFRIGATRVLREYLLKGYAVRRPVSREESSEVKDSLEQKIKNLEVISETQFNEIYTALAELVSKKSIADKQPKRKIGFID